MVLISQMLARRVSWRRVLLFLGCVVILGLASPHGLAWWHLRAGRAALERYQNPEARRHLERCLSTWPTNRQALILASRAARRAGDYEQAQDYLTECKRVSGLNADEITFEWALLRAAMGDLQEVDTFLMEQTLAGGARAALVWEALAEGYMRMYRILNALTCLERWLALQPNNLRAITLRGDLWWQVHATQKALPDYRQVIERDPTQLDVRWRLSLGLLEQGQYPEAREHLRQVLLERPGDPEVLARLARCQNILGEREEALATLEGVLREHPKNAYALRTRGQIALSDGQASEAERWLRQALAIQEDDYLTTFLLQQSLRQQGQTEAAATFARKAEQLKDRAERLSEIGSRKMSERPHDPALHLELGKLLLNLGNKELAERWFLSALNEDARFVPAHEALADFYDAQGDKEKADFHRSQMRTRP